MELGDVLSKNAFVSSIEHPSSLFEELVSNIFSSTFEEYCIYQWSIRLEIDLCYLKKAYLSWSRCMIVATFGQNDLKA